MPIKMHQGEQLKALLAAKNKSVISFANHIGRTRNQVYEYFKKDTLHYSVLSQAAEFLEVPIADFVGSDLLAAATLNDEPGVYVTGNISAIHSAIPDHYVQVPFLSARAQAGLPYISYDYSDVSWITETYPVFMPLVNITDRHIVIEVRGDSMEPGIRYGALVLAESIDGNDWRYESGGVYAVLYGPGRLVVKRIKTNNMEREKVLHLHSDNEQHGTITVHVNEIHRMWKVLFKVSEVVQ